MLPHINHTQREDTTKDNKSTTDVTFFVNQPIEYIKYYYNEAIKNPTEFYLAALPCISIILSVSAVYLSSIAHEDIKIINKSLKHGEMPYSAELRELKLLFSSQLENLSRLVTYDNTRIGNGEYLFKMYKCASNKLEILHQEELSQIKLFEQMNLAWFEECFEATTTFFIGITAMSVILAGHSYSIFNGENNISFFTMDEQ